MSEEEPKEEESFCSTWLGSSFPILLLVTRKRAEFLLLAIGLAFSVTIYVGSLKVNYAKFGHVDSCGQTSSF